MNIYTKTGDAGVTSLLGGRRVAKSHARIEAYGTVDELNACVGLVADLPENAARRPLLRQVQDRLFTIGSTLAADAPAQLAKLPALHAEDVHPLEHAIDAMEEQLAPLRSFVLPGGHTSVSFCHLARTVCRRAERAVVRLHEHEPIDVRAIVYLNRLSDYLFVLARLVGQEVGAEALLWQPGRADKNEKA